MINSIPFVGWFLSLCVNVSMAIPFWLCWTLFGIGRTYFDFLPLAWQSIPFWSCVGLFVSVSIIQAVFVPKIAIVSQTNGNNCGTKKDETKASEDN